MLAGQQPTVVRTKLDKVRVVDMTMRRHHYVNKDAIRRHHYAYKDQYLKGTASNALVAAPHFLSIKDYLLRNSQISNKVATPLEWQIFKVSIVFLP